MPGEKLRSDKFDTPSINWESKNLVEQWNYFERVCKRVFKGPWKDMPKEEQAAHLQLWVGMEGDKLIQSWKLTEEQEKDPAVFFTKFKAHFEPKCNPRVERHQMREIKQDKEETIDDYIARLRLQANRCDFKDNYDQAVIEQLIEGTNSTKVRKTLLAKDSTLTLDAAIEVARLEESANKSMKIMNDSSKATNNVDAIQTDSKKSGSDQCTHCGRTDHKFDRSVCPAIGTICNKCKKPNHWQKVCRGGKFVPPNGRGRGSFGRGGSQYQNQGSGFGYSNYDNYNYRGRKQFSKGYGRGGWNSRGRGMHTIYGGEQAQEQCQGACSCCSYSGNEREYQVHDIQYQDPRDQPQRVDRMTFFSIGISAVGKNKNTEAFANIKIDTGDKRNQVGVEMKVDTGAEADTIPLHVFRQVFPNRLDRNGMPSHHTVIKDNTKLYGYNGLPIIQLGRIQLSCTFKDKKKIANFFIVDVPGPAILGLLTCQALGIVTLNCAVTFNRMSNNYRSEKYVIPQRRDERRDRCEVHRTIQNHPEPPRTIQTTHTTGCKMNDTNNVNSVNSVNDNKTTKQPRQTGKIKSFSDLKEMYPDRFEGVGKFPGEYHIQLEPNAIPKHSGRANACPINIVDNIKNQLDEMVDDGIITPEPEPTDWCSNVVYSLKPSGKWRICLSPKHLNKYIKRTYHHTPTTAELTHKLKGSTVFSKLDARHGYWAVVLDHESSLLTTFNTPFGKYRYLRLPFGLKCSQDEFQKRMDHVLGMCPGTIGIADDVVVFGENDAQHDENIHRLMETARDNGLVFNGDKCIIKAKSIPFFGWEYDAVGVHPDPAKLEAVRVIDIPRNKSQLATFLGLTNYLSSFVPNMSAISAPLRDLQKHDVEYVWSTAQQEAFDKIKQLLLSHTTLNYFDPGKESTIEVDASLEGLGAALLQDDKVIAFASKALTDAESRYANIEREMLSVVFACKKFKHYVYGKHFIVESDHKPLEMISLKDLTAAPDRLKRMLLEVQGFDFTIRYKPGPQMHLADPLSRLKPIPSPEIEGMNVQVLHIKFGRNILDQIREYNNGNADMILLRETIIEGWPENFRDVPRAIKPYYSMRDELTIENDVILKGKRVLIPPHMQEDIINRIHEGHMGIVKCKLRAKDSVYWIGINQQIEDKIHNCHQCQKYQRSQVKEPLEQFDIPSRPWETVGSDLFELDGEDYLLVTDYYSKSPFVRSIPPGRKTAEVIINLTSSIFSEQGIPDNLVSDNGRQYDCKEYREFAEEFEFNHIRCSPRHPQENGFIERSVQTCKNVIKKAKESGQNVFKALLALRTTPIDAEIPSPAEMLNGRKLKASLPICISNTLPCREQIAHRLEVRQHQQKHYFDSKAVQNKPQLLPEQKVFVQDPLKKHWVPGQIKEVISPRAVNVEVGDKNLIRNTIHVRPDKGSYVNRAVPQEYLNHTVPNDNYDPIQNTVDTTPNVTTGQGNLSSSTTTHTSPGPCPIHGNKRPLALTIRRTGENSHETIFKHGIPSDPISSNITGDPSGSVPPLINPSRPVATVPVNVDVPVTRYGRRSVPPNRFSPE